MNYCKWIIRYFSEIIVPHHTDWTRTKNRLIVGRRVRIYIWGSNSSTFCFIWGLCISTTADQDLVTFLSAKEHCIFTKYTLARTLSTITSNHFPSPLPILTSHHNFPSWSAPKCKGTFYFNKTHAWLPMMLFPHFCKISDGTICFFWLDNSPILLPRW